MHPDTKEIAEHMKDFGCCLLGRAAYDSVFSEHGRPYAHASSLTLTAHGTEIIIKARIAQDHPLLIFESLPKSTKTDSFLTISELFVDGRTIGFFDLPERLWATTGYRIRNIQKFNAFGKLRNQIMHFAVPNTNDIPAETLKFIFEEIDPLLQAFWNDSVLNYAEEWDYDMIPEGYLHKQIDNHEIQPVGIAATRLEETRPDWI